MKDCNKKIPFINIQKLQNFPYIEEDFDALTDYGLISKIGGGLNQLMVDVENQNSIIEELEKDFKDLKDYVDKNLQDVDEIKQEITVIEETLRLYRLAIEENANNITLVRTELLGIINENYNRLQEYIDYNVEDLNYKIEHLKIGEISVYNPTSGLLQPLQEVINSLYDASNRDGLTATEFDALDLSATNFDAYQITAREFDSEGKTILV